MELEMKLLGYVVTIAICLIALYFGITFFKVKRPIKGILALVFIPVFIYMVYFFDWGAPNGGRTLDHPCAVCGKATSMEIDGRYYCLKHYNAKLFG